MKTVKEKLIDATFYEVFTNGYNASSLTKILLRAEVKKGAMYHYFSSKKEMVLAMIEDKIENRINNKWKVLENTEENIVDTLIQIIKDIDNWDLSYGCPLGNLIQESMNEDDEFDNILTCILNKWEALLSKCLSKAKSLNQINQNTEIEQSSKFIIASIEGAILLSKKSHDKSNFIMCMNQLSFYINTLRNDI